MHLNPLTMNDDYSRHRNSAAYQLAQSVLKIGSVLAERVGLWEVGGCTALADSAWRLLQLAVEKARSALDGPLLWLTSAWRLLQLAIERAWSALDGPFFCLLVQTGVENGPFTL